MSRTMNYPQLFRRRRRGPGDGRWHCCTQCRGWPQHDYEEMNRNPAADHQICYECRRLVEQGRCRGGRGWFA